MAELRIPQVPGWVVDALQSMAERSGRSLEEEVRIQLSQVASEGGEESTTELAAIREGLASKFETLTDSTDAIRADRAARG